MGLEEERMGVGSETLCRCHCNPLTAALIRDWAIMPEPETAQQFVDRVNSAQSDLIRFTPPFYKTRESPQHLLKWHNVMPDGKIVT